jgi:hypothetical protein
VAARKIVIALIGVFGTEMGDMQVHLTAILVFTFVVSRFFFSQDLFCY